MTIYWVLGGIVALVVLYLATSGPSVVSLVQKAKKEESVEPILKAAKGLSPKRRSYFFQQSIELLWRSYERELATEVLREFVAMHPDEKICQYWLDQALEHEGRMARRVLGRQFLDTYYRPDVAATCGIASS